jgi:hypothetical protein
MTFLNNTGLERLWSKITAKLNLKVDKVNGKGLSTNDYTTTEKNKLAGIATGATKTVVDTALSSSSTNPVQNKVVNTAISNLNTLVGDTAVSTQITNAVANKVDKVSGKGLSTNDYTTAEKNKLSGIDTGANKTIVDSVLSTTSTNPVQNKVVNTAISNLNTLVGDKSVSSQISTAIASKADIGHTHTKSEVGLGNVDNTTDADKSVKYATSAGSAASVTGIVGVEHGGTDATSRNGGYSNLMSGGIYTGNLNDCLNCGTYIFATDNVTNYPSGITGWAFLEVQTYSRDSSEVLQTATYVDSNKKFSRTHINGNWSSWQENLTMQDAYKQNFKLIPSGDDLNNYKQNGVYVSAQSSNKIKNLPIYFGSDSAGAFTLVVTGISNSSYTTQILYTIGEPPYIYVRNQYNWQTPWTWTSWHRLINEEQISYKSIVNINAENRSVEPGIKMNRYRPNGNKYTRFYEADDDNAQLAIAQSLPGSGSEGITRLNYNGNYASLRGDVPLYLGEYFAPIARFYFSDYGTSLPAAGNKGRVFFKKV